MRVAALEQRFQIQGSEFFNTLSTTIERRALELDRTWGSQRLSSTSVLRRRRLQKDIDNALDHIFDEAIRLTTSKLAQSLDPSGASYDLAIRQLRSRREATAKDLARAGSRDLAIRLVKMAVGAICSLVLGILGNNIAAHGVDLLTYFGYR